MATDSSTTTTTPDTGAAKRPATADSAAVEEVLPKQHTSTTEADRASELLLRANTEGWGRTITPKQERRDLERATDDIRRGLAAVDPLFETLPGCRPEVVAAGTIRLDGLEVADNPDSKLRVTTFSLPVRIGGAPALVIWTLNTENARTLTLAPREEGTRAVASGLDPLVYQLTGHLNRTVANNPLDPVERLAWVAHLKRLSTPPLTPESPLLGGAVPTTGPGVGSAEFGLPSNHRVAVDAHRHV